MLQDPLPDVAATATSVVSETPTHEKGQIFQIMAGILHLLLGSVVSLFAQDPAALPVAAVQIANATAPFGSNFASQTFVLDVLGPKLTKLDSIFGDDALLLAPTKLAKKAMKPFLSDWRGQPHGVSFSHLW